MEKTNAPLFRLVRRGNPAHASAEPALGARSPVSLFTFVDSFTFCPYNENE